MTTTIKREADPNNVLSIIMGGGQGSRLFPLTRERSKPAVPLAGKYRLVDIPISNCINSGMKRVYLLTQFNSASLHRHVYGSFKFDHFTPGFVEILAAAPTPTDMSWYQGTADAVRKNLNHLPEVSPNIPPLQPRWRCRFRSCSPSADSPPCSSHPPTLRR